jgi:hypothetical protein
MRRAVFHGIVCVHVLVLVSVLVLVLVLVSAPARAEALVGVTPLFSAHDDQGFADTTTLDETGGKLVLVASNAARVVDLDHPEANGPHFDLGKLPAPPTELHLLPSGDLLALAGEPGTRTATVLTSDGKVTATYAATVLAFRGETLSLLTVKGDSHDLRWVKLAGGATLGKRHLVIAGAERNVTGLSAPILFYMWRAGYTQLVGKKEGAYDKKADRHLPNTEVTVDLVSGKLIRDEIIADMIPHASILALRRENPADAFIALVRDGGLELITQDDHRVPLTGRLRDGADYDLQTLAQDELPDGRVAFSLVEGGIMDLFVLDAAGNPLGVARIPTHGHPLAWHVRGDTLEVLEKHKHYGSGGADVAVYKLLLTDAKRP